MSEFVFVFVSVYVCAHARLHIKNAGLKYLRNIKLNLCKSIFTITDKDFVSCLNKYVVPVNNKSVPLAALIDDVSSYTCFWFSQCYCSLENKL